MVITVYIYVSIHKNSIKLYIEKQFNQSFCGTLTIKNIEPNFWKQFPNISLVLDGVTIRDNNWQIHQKDFGKVEHIYIGIKVLPLLSGAVNIRKIIVSDGSLFAFQDSLGQSNLSILCEQKNTFSERKISVHHFEFEHFKMIFQHYNKKKNIDIEAQKITGQLSINTSKIDLNIIGGILVNQCSFNTDKGSFFTNKKMKLNTHFSYNRKEQKWLCTAQKIELGEQKMNLSMSLNFAENEYSIILDTKKLQFDKTIAMLTPRIYQKLSVFKVSKSIPITIKIEGKLDSGSKPFIEVSSKIHHTEIDTKYGNFKVSEAAINYRNGLPNSPFLGDEYATLQIKNIAASYADIQFRADSTEIQNLKHPNITTHIISNFDTKQLNNLLGAKSILFGNGMAKLDLRYAGKLNIRDSMPVNINGWIKIQNSSFVYLPRKLKFGDCNLQLRFEKQDVYLEKSSLISAKNHLNVEASAPDFMQLFLMQPDAISIHANIESEKIDLSEFQSFLQKRKDNTPAKQSKSKDLLDNAFAASSAFIKLSANQLTFKKFDAKNIDASLEIAPNKIVLKTINLNHADGHFQLSGVLKEDNLEQNHFDVQADVRNASIPKMLFSFDNFGQKTFTAKNIEGKISLKSHLTGRFDSSGKIVQKSLKGDCLVEIENGSLIDFAPLQKIGKLFFKKKRLSLVHFQPIKNRFSIDGTAIKIPPMWVNSDLIKLKVEGVYELIKGTVLAIEIPLFSNDNNENGSKFGYRLYIDAKDDENGDLKFTAKLQNAAINAAREERKKIKKAIKK